MHLGHSIWASLLWDIPILFSRSQDNGTCHFLSNGSGRSSTNHPWAPRKVHFSREKNIMRISSLMIPGSSRRKSKLDFGTYQTPLGPRPQQDVGLYNDTVLSLSKKSESSSDVDESAGRGVNSIKPTMPVVLKWNNAMSSHGWVAWKVS